MCILEWGGEGAELLALAALQTRESGIPMQEKRGAIQSKLFKWCWFLYHSWNAKPNYCALAIFLCSFFISIHISLKRDDYKTEIEILLEGFIFFIQGRWPLFSYETDIRCRF
jgi:hypothetical protein